MIDWYLAIEALFVTRSHHWMALEILLDLAERDSILSLLFCQQYEGHTYWAILHAIAFMDNPVLAVAYEQMLLGGSDTLLNTTDLVKAGTKVGYSDDRQIIYALTWVSAFHQSAYEGIHAG